jgi:hypothetical protein
MDAARSLPLDDLAQVEDLIQVGEQRVAFENLCTQIYEYDVRLPSYLRDLLAEAGQALGVAPRYWMQLEGPG